MRSKTLFIPYGRQHIDAGDIKAVVSALKSDWITQGARVGEFEKALCAYTGAKYAVAVSSGTAALHLACLAAGIKSGDEVITSPLTFVASANCVLYCQGKPVFADIEPDTANIIPEEVSGLITKKTKAIIPVHFAGHSCQMDKIQAIAKKHNLIVIEDAAHALGGEYKGKKIGACAYADMAIFSFHPVKHITTGEGGAILTNSKELYEKMMMLRTHGITKDPARLKHKDHGPWYYEMQELGFNYRITDIQCALGISQLKKLDRFVAKRRAIAEIYNRAFRNNPYFDIPLEHSYARSSYHLYPIRLKSKFALKREEVFAHFRKAGLGVQVHYLPVYLHPFYQQLGLKPGSCPNAQTYYLKVISLPIYSSLPLGDARKVIQIVEEFLCPR